MDKAFVGLAILLFIGNLLSFASEGVKGAVTTTLTLPVSTSLLVIDVVSTTDFVVPGQIVIGEELIDYTSVTATTFNGLTRGAEDTTPGEYSAGQTVSDPGLGLIVNMLDFRVAQSDVPLFGPLITGFNIGVQFVQFIGRVIVWDYSYWDSDVMGVPMRYGQFIMFCLSVGVVMRLFIILRSGGVSL